MTMFWLVLLAVVEMIGGFIVFAIGCRKNDRGNFVLGLALILLSFLTIERVSFVVGSTYHSNMPLSKGMTYETLCVDDDKAGKCYAYLKWKDGKRRAVFELKERPPEKFIVNDSGEYVAIQ